MHIKDLATLGVFEPVKKAKEPKKEERNEAAKHIKAEIVITLRSNPTLTGMRFTSMKQAIKEYDKLMTAVTQDDANMVVLNSDLMTAAVLPGEVILAVLVNKEAADAAFAASAARNNPVPNG